VAQQESAEATRQINLIDGEIARLTALISDLDTEINKQTTLITKLEPKPPAEDIDTVTSPTSQSLKDLIGEVQSLEQQVADAKLTVRKATEVEEKAAKDQFRAEVAAAKADPDTYAPGNPSSADPVTQVSISVIGEGVLHLRGPRDGVVKIREMIDQIDHPVGQVKLGIMTVQINGEQGARMENTMRRMEGHMSRARFLTYGSSHKKCPGCLLAVFAGTINPHYERRIAFHT